jgi:hypothetical protein
LVLRMLLALTVNDHNIGLQDKRQTGLKQVLEQGVVLKPLECNVLAPICSHPCVQIMLKMT